MFKTFQNLAARFNAQRRIDKLTQTSLMEPAGVMANGESDESKVLFGAMDTVERILMERARLDMEGRENEPLVVVMGEQHDYSAHFLHHMLVLKTLKDSGEKTAVGMENRDGFVVNWLKHARGFNADDDALREAYAEANEHGDMGLLHVYASGEPKLAPYAQKVFQRFLLDSGMPVRFTDAAFVHKHLGEETYSEEPQLDKDDPETAQSIEECWVEQEKEFDPDEPDGIWIRNHHAARLIEEFAEEQGARIVIQFSGNSHVLGKNDALDPMYFPGNESLSACIKERGLPVLAVVLNNREFHQAHIPDDHRLDWGKEIYIQKDLPDFKYRHKDTPFETVFDSKEQERVDTTLTAIGMESATLTQDDPRWKHTPHEFFGKFRNFETLYQGKLADKAAGLWSGSDMDDNQTFPVDGQDFE